MEDTRNSGVTQCIQLKKWVTFSNYPFLLRSCEMEALRQQTMAIPIATPAIRSTQQASRISSNVTLLRPRPSAQQHTMIVDAMVQYFHAIVHTKDWLYNGWNYEFIFRLLFEAVDHVNPHCGNFLQKKWTQNLQPQNIKLLKLVLRNRI